MLKIRLRRMGSRHKPFYRVVVSDSRQTPLAAAVEEIGFYDPRRDPATISIDTERVDYWTSVGAQLSGAVRKLVKQAKSQPAAAPETAAEPATPETAAEPAALETATAEADAPTAEADAPTAEADAPTAAAEETTAEEGAPAEGAAEATPA